MNSQNLFYTLNICCNISSRQLQNVYIHTMFDKPLSSDYAVLILQCNTLTCGSYLFSFPKFVLRFCVN